MSRWFRTAVAAAVCFAGMGSVGSASIRSGRWLRIGPEGGDVVAFAAAPSNSARIYLATGTRKIFRSDDGGRRWHWASSGLPAASRILSIAVDAKDPDVVYAAGDGVFKTTDGAGHWQEIAGVLTPAGDVVATTAVADPLRSGIVYVATSSSSNAVTEGILESTDGGATWQSKNDGIPGPSRINSLVIAPSNPSTLYASSDGRVFRSDDGARSWVATARPDAAAQALAVDPANSLHAFAPPVETRDGGATWTPIGSNPPPLLALALAVDPETGSLYVVSGSPAELWRYESRGGWKLLGARPPEDAAESVGLVRGALLVGLERDGLFRSTDGGMTWGSSNSGLKAVPISGFSVSPSESTRLWVSASDGRIFRSDDEGSTWTQVFGADVDVLAIAADGVDPSSACAITLPPPGETVLGGGYAARRTADGGNTWPSSTAGHWHEIVADTQQSGIYYAIGEAPHGNSGIVKSVDGGATWSPADAGFGEIYVASIAIDPLVASRLYASGDFSSTVWRSDDAGRSWLAVGDTNDAAAYGLIVGSNSDSTVLAIGRQAAWKSSDFGAKWNRIEGLPGPVFAFAEDPGIPGVFFAATAGARFFESTDAGQTWTEISSAGFSDEPVIELAATSSRRVFAITESGIFEADVQSLHPIPAPEPAPIDGRGRSPRARGLRRPR